MDKIFKQIRNHFGSVPEIASALNIKRQAYYEWENQGIIPELRCYQIEVLTGGRFKAKRLIKAAKSEK